MVSVVFYPDNNVTTFIRAMEMTELEFKSQFEKFIRTFCVGTPDENSYFYYTEKSPYYIEQLKKAVEGSSFTQLDNFQVNLIHIKSHSEKLLDVIINNPADCIVYMDEVLSDIANDEYKDMQISSLSVKVSLIRHPCVTSMRNLNPDNIETLVSFRGIIIRASAIIPDMKIARFRCISRNAPNQPPGTICDHEESVPSTSGEVQEPLQCSRCGANHSFEIYHGRCIFGNKQLLKIQETLENIPEGETPQTVMAYVYDALVDVAKPGDFMEITGIYKTAGVRVGPRTRAISSVFRTYIDVNSLYKDHLNKLTLTKKDLEIPAADAVFENDDFPKDVEFQDYSEAFKKKMSDIAKDPDVYEKLVKSFAPNVWECDDVKKGLLCQLFGGTSKLIGGRMSRSDIHILLCGDPSTAKSQLLQYVHKLTPRGVYTCGRGSSAVGLTASVTRDVENREFVLESGAIVLSDKGICCIDEFDKMDDSARTILHEVMEQQTISIAKAGIVCSLNARTAILASANPINSRYDTSKSVVENINLPPSLMSRFDLVYLTLDTPNPNLDRALAKHLCNLYAVEAEAKQAECPIPRKTLEQYISYARSTCKPKISADAGALLVDVYTDLRQKGGVGEKSLNATPRQLESLIRLAEALAKMQLADFVSRQHVQEAIRLIQVATYTALIDPNTGRIDFDQLNAGISGESRIKKHLLERAIIDCLKSSAGMGYTRTELSELVADKLRRENKYSLDPTGQQFNLLLREMEDFGIIGKIHGGKFIREQASVHKVTRMEEMRAILDSLMGTDRNSLTDAPKKATFKDPDVCHNFLIDFCPHDLFPNTKSDLGPCPNKHSDAIREQFLSDPDHDYYHRKYEREFFNTLHRLVECVEERIRKGQQRILGPDEGHLEQEKQKKFDQMKDEIASLLQKAQESGEKGNIAEAEQYTRKVVEIRCDLDRMSALSHEFLAISNQEKSLRVCSVCGAMQSLGDATSRFESHVSGKQHVGYERIRATYAALKAKYRPQNDDITKKEEPVTNTKDAASEAPTTAPTASADSRNEKSPNGRNRSEPRRRVSDTNSRRRSPSSEYRRHPHSSRYSSRTYYDRRDSRRPRGGRSSSPRRRRSPSEHRYRRSRTPESSTRFRRDDDRRKRD